MSGIKLILFFGLLTCFYGYLRFFRTILLDRVIAVGFLVVGVAFIAVPDLTTSLAVLLGVGRGTDLMFYLFALGSCFAFILLYSKIAQMLITQTELVRYLAIREVKNAGSANTVLNRPDRLSS